MIAVLVIVVSSGSAFAIFNRLVRLRNMVRESWRNIDTELQRRYDLIPNLVSTVKGYAAHEREVFDSVTQLRTDAMAEHGPPDAQAPLEQALGQGVAQLMAVAENYPDLKASEQLPRVAAGARRHRGSHPGVAAHLQRQRPRVRLARADVPVADHRPAVQLRRSQPYFEVEPAVRDAGPPSVDLSGRCQRLSTAGSTGDRGDGPSPRG